ncbi:MAG: radical SAM family heme chaperone HemW [Planctomycetota bacterium]|nr:radical SAM family heme chaperone HemW [Planctomycetota bacterium]
MPRPEPESRTLEVVLQQLGSPGVASRVDASAALATAPKASATSLYIHVPFCFHKCHYCDFYSIVDPRDRQEPFTTRLITELDALAPWANSQLQTVFIGGGTPSLLAPRLWTRLLEHLDRLFATRTISTRRGGAGEGGEFTVECNPETMTPELADILVAGGVSRVSMGAQSFNPAHLKTLERWHDPANVPKALEMTRRAGITRDSIDLIFGIPGQSMADWLSDLQTACDLGTQHLSCYGLTYEQGTAMTARLRKGEFTPADEDLEADMFDATVEFLAARGLRRYELSNFAMPGAECRHNLVYWRQGNWLAAGPAASGHIDGLRWKNTPRLDDYLGSSNTAFAPICEAESPKPRRNLVELLMTGLRLSEGLDARRVLAHADAIDAQCAPRLLAWALAQEQAGLLTTLNDRWCLTPDGMRITNTVILAAAEAVDPD